MSDPGDGQWDTQDRGPDGEVPSTTDMHHAHALSRTALDTFPANRLVQEVVADRYKPGDQDDAGRR